jgi:hypothetical protein
MQKKEFISFPPRIPLDPLILAPQLLALIRNFGIDPEIHNYKILPENKKSLSVFAERLLIGLPRLGSNQ